MREWLLQLLCNHKWREDNSIYYRERGGKGIVETTFYCPKCNKVRKEIMQVK